MILKPIFSLLIQDFSPNMAFIILKLYQHVYNIHSEGTESQNFKIVLSFILCQKTGRFLLFFHNYFSRFHKKKTLGPISKI